MTGMIAREVIMNNENNRHGKQQPQPFGGVEIVLPNRYVPVSTHRSIPADLIPGLIVPYNSFPAQCFPRRERPTQISQYQNLAATDEFALTSARESVWHEAK